jgi:hypothetical protein
MPQRAPDRGVDCRVATIQILCMLPTKPWLLIGTAQCALVGLERIQDSTNVVNKLYSSYIVGYHTNAQSGDRISSKALTERARRKPQGFSPGGEGSLRGFSPKSSCLRCTRFSCIIGA